jgi:hypothetical protein
MALPWGIEAIPKNTDVGFRTRRRPSLPPYGSAITRAPVTRPAPPPRPRPWRRHPPGPPTWSRTRSSGPR